MNRLNIFKDFVTSLLKKLKQKLNLKYLFRSLLAATALLTVFLGVAAPQQVNAITYNPSDLQVKLDSYTPGAGGQMKKDNLIQVGKETGGIGIQAEITLLSPASLTLGTDTFDMNTAETDANGQKNGGLTITNLGAGLDTMGSGSGAGGIHCTTQTLWVFSSSSNQQYLSCNFRDSNDIPSGQAIPANTPVKININVDFTKYDTLDRNNVTTAQRIIIYPYAKFDRALVNNQMSFPTGGFPIYIQFYNSQADAAAAIASGQRPQSVPAYGGGTVSTGQSSDTGSSLLGLVNKIIVFLLGLINELVYFVFYWLIAPLIQAMLSIHAYKDSFVNVIYPGWEVVRNVCNIFFIIAIIGIALATLFRLEGYQFRHLLVQLILAALLVNFSLVIAQAVLALADTIQSQFLPNNVDVVRSLARDLMVSNTRDAVWNLDVAKYGSFSYTVTFFFWVALAVGSFAVFAGLCAFLVIRVVALWVLLMVSPIAFVGGILPSTAGLRKQWWDNFFKYAFFTPIIAFFLNMAAVVSNTTRDQALLTKVTGADFTDSNAPELTAFVFKVASNVILLVFLIAAIKVADQFGIYGASAVSEMATKGWQAPFRMSGGLIRDQYDKGADYMNRKRMQAALSLSQNGRNPLARGLGALIATPERTKAKKEDRAKDLHTYEHQLGERYTNRVRSSAGKLAHEGELHTFNEQIKEASGHLTVNNGAQAAEAIEHALHNKNDPEITRAGTVSAAILAAAEKEDFDSLLAKGINGNTYGDTQEDYLKFLRDLETIPGMTHERVIELAAKLDTTFKKTNRTKYTGVLRDDAHTVVHEAPSVNAITGYREGEQEFEKVFKLDPSAQEAAIAALPPTVKAWRSYYEMRRAQKVALQRKGVKARLADYDPTSLVERDASGVKRINSDAADMLTQNSPAVYAQAGSLSAANRATLENMDPVAMQAAFYQSIRRDQISKGINDRAGAMKKATDKVTEVHKKLLNIEVQYDPAAGAWGNKVKVPKNDVSIEDVLKEDPRTNVNLSSIVESKVRNSVISYYDSGWKNLNTYTRDLSAKITASAHTDLPAAQQVRDDVFAKVQDHFADRFEPAKLSSGRTLNAPELTAVKTAIKTSFNDVVTDPANANRSLGSLKADLQARLDSAAGLGGTVLTPAERTEAINTILAGLA